MKRWVTAFLFFFSTFVAYAQVGWLEITCPDHSAYEAHVYENGEFVTQIPAKIALSVGSHDLMVRKKDYKDFEIKVKVIENEVASVKVILERNFIIARVASAHDAMIYIDGEEVAIGKVTQPIPFGKHSFKAESPGCYPSEIELMVSSATGEINIPHPKPIVGSLSIQSNVNGADVIVNGEKVGTSPIVYDNLRIGDYCVEISEEGYVSESVMVSVSENKCSQVSFHLEKLSSVYVKTNVYSPSITFDGEELSANPCFVRQGQYQATVSAQGYKSKKKLFDVKEGVNTFNCRLNRYYGPQFSEYGSLYANVGYQLLRYPAIEVTLGFQLSRFEYELTILGGWGWSEDMLTTSGQIYSFKPEFSVFNTLGYFINIGNWMRFTPQIGFGYMKVNGANSGNSLEKGYSDEGGFDILDACQFNFNAKIEIALCRWLALYAKPMYVVPIVLEDENLKYAMSASPEVKRYFKGFDVVVGANFHLDF